MMLSGVGSAALDRLIERAIYGAQSAADYAGILTMVIVPVDPDESHHDADA